MFLLEVTRPVVLNQLSLSSSLVSLNKSQNGCKTVIFNVKKLCSVAFKLFQLFLGVFYLSGNISVYIVAQFPSILAGLGYNVKNILTVREAILNVFNSHTKEVPVEILVFWETRLIA